MKKEKLKEVLTNMGYKPYSIRSILSGLRKPTLEKAVKIEDLFGIPVKTWVDVKTYLEEKS
jgi:plasmid maintenance system antidote protein VapI